jgi:SAM-dependent methyltransferase
MLEKTRLHYDAVYKKNDYFGHQTILYRAFILGLVKKIGLSKNSFVLDAACGQGYLSYYLLCSGMNVFCTDISITGLRTLDRYDTLFEGKRVVSDILQPPFKNIFDLVLVRSCSLHNDFFQQRKLLNDFINNIIDCVRPGGTACIIYNSKLTGKGNPWFNPTLECFAESVKNSRLCDVKFYAVNKIDSFLLGRYGFNSYVTNLNVFLAGIFHKNCEILAIGRKTNY